MFRRLLIEDWTAIFTIVAFCTALSIYVTIFYRTVRMRRSKSDHLANLPFADEPALAPQTPPANHE